MKRIAESQLTKDNGENEDESQVSRNLGVICDTTAYPVQHVFDRKWAQGSRKLIPLLFPQES
jgi:hypothetical protein